MLSCVLEGEVMKIKIPVIWEMCGMVEIEADSLEEAIAGFHSVEDDLPLPEWPRIKHMLVSPELKLSSL